MLSGQNDLKQFQRIAIPDKPKNNPRGYPMDESIVQQEINKYKKFRKVDGATYRKVNYFLRKRTYITAREWALARLCTDFRTASGAEMTFIGKHLPELVPFMEEPYSPQAVNQARHSFKKKVRKASATFFYGAMCGFFTTDELDDLLFEASEVSRFLLEVEGTTLDIDEEIDIEDRITKVMRSVGETAKTILKTRNIDETKSPEESSLSVQPLPIVNVHDRTHKPLPLIVQKNAPLNPDSEHLTAISSERLSPEKRTIMETDRGAVIPVNDELPEGAPFPHSTGLTEMHNNPPITGPGEDDNNSSTDPADIQILPKTEDTPP